METNNKLIEELKNIYDFITDKLYYEQLEDFKYYYGIANSKEEYTNEQKLFASNRIKELETANKKQLKKIKGAYELLKSVLY